MDLEGMPVSRPASEQGDRRLYPRLTDPSYLVLRSRRRIFEGWAAAIKGEELTMLDVGGRLQPYRPLFEKRLRRYVSIDLRQSECVAVVGNGEALPFMSGSFDLAIGTQVFEFFENPAAAMRGIHTVLKPGGIFVASFAAFAPEFVDRERWRFLRMGLQTILAPFPEVEIVPELDSVCSMVRTVNVALDVFVRYPAARWIHRLTLCPLLNLLGLALGGLNLPNERFAPNFSVRAVKGM